MSIFTETLKEYYDSFKPEPEPEINSDMSYRTMRHFGLLITTSFRLPAPTNAMLDAMLPLTPYDTKSEMVYQMIHSQIQEFSQAFGGEQLDDAAQAALEEWKKQQVEEGKQPAEKQEKLV